MGTSSELSGVRAASQPASRGIKVDICNTAETPGAPAFCLLNNNNLMWCHSFNEASLPPTPRISCTALNYRRNIILFKRFQRYCDLARDTDWTSFSLQINWLSLSLSLSPKQTLIPYWNPYLALGLYHDLVKLFVIRKMKSVVSYSISPHIFPGSRRKCDIDVGMKITLMWSQVSQDSLEKSPSSSFCGRMGQSWLIKLREQSSL